MLEIEQARKAVRLSARTFDDELDALIQAGIADLKTAGIREMDDDALYDNALRNYVKGNFEPGAPEAEKCREIYEGIKITMKLTDRYREVGSGA